MAQQPEQVQYEPGKIFVGGLSWDTTDVSMRAYFEQYGEVNDCVVMKDANQPAGLKRNRGFGFVKFENPASVDTVLKHGNHFIDNKQVDPKRAALKGGAAGGGIGGDHEKKIFAGGLASSTTEDDVRDYFNSYLQKKGHPGIVIDVDFKVDRSTKRMRGFGFVGFDSVEARNKVLEMSHHQIGGKMVEVKEAQPRGAITSNPTPQLMTQHQSPYGAPAPYQQPYQQGAAANGQYAGYYTGTGGQFYANPYPTQQQPAYGSGYNSAASYSYDHSSYPRTQTSTDRQDAQSYYHHQNPYGGGQQMGGGGYQDTTSFQGRSGYPGTQDAGYGHQMAGYGRGGNQQQAQPRYGGGTGIGNYSH